MGCGRRTVVVFKILFRFRVMQGSFQRTPTVDNTGNVRIIYNIMAPSYNHFCSGRTISIIYSKCMSVALGTPHATRMQASGLRPLAC